MIVLLVFKICLTQRKPCLHVTGTDFYRLVQVPDPLFYGGLDESPDIVLKRIRRKSRLDAKGLFVQIQRGIDLHGDLPGQLIFNIDQLVQVSLLFQRGSHAGTMHHQHPRCRRNAAVGHGVVAKTT